jgi:hypothetical protein
MMKPCLFLIVAISATAQTSSQKVYFADQYCAVKGTLDQTCLGRAIAAAGNNSQVVIPPGTYNFSSKLTVSNLTNVEIVGSGDSSIIKSNGTAFECDNCTGGGISNINLSSSVTPTVIACKFDVPRRSMSCAGLPTSDPGKIITLDPWNQNFGHIPTSTDAQLLGSQTLLSSAQTSENFDSGVFYYKPTNVTIKHLSGNYAHIVLMDSIGAIVIDNKIMGGNGAADTKKSMTVGNRCGAICLWFSANQPPGWFSNRGNIISNNIVTFPASEGIAVNNAINTVVSNNQVAYGGESGILTGQGLSGTIATPTGTLAAGSTTISGLSSTAGLAAGQPVVSPYLPDETKIVSIGSNSIVLSHAPTANSTESLNVYHPGAMSYFSKQTTITGNVVHHMDFDGIDAGSDYPHTNRVSVYLTVTGNISCNNFGTGIFGDGLSATVSGNTVCNNESYGIALDNADSTITRNTAVDNNRQKSNGNAQIQIGGITGSGLVATGGNTIVGNRANTSERSGINGFGITTTNQKGPSNVLSDNYTTGGLPDSHAGYVTGTTNPSAPAAVRSSSSGKKAMGACTLIMENGLVKGLSGC